MQCNVPKCGAFWSRFGVVFPLSSLRSWPPDLLPTRFGAVLGGSRGCLGVKCGCAKNHVLLWERVLVRKRGVEWFYISQLCRCAREKTVVVLGIADGYMVHSMGGEKGVERMCGGRANMQCNVGRDGSKLPSRAFSLMFAVLLTHLCSSVLLIHMLIAYSAGRIVHHNPSSCSRAPLLTAAHSHLPSAASSAHMEYTPLHPCSGPLITLTQRNTWATHPPTFPQAPPATSINTPVRLSFKCPLTSILHTPPYFIHIHTSYSWLH